MHVEFVQKNFLQVEHPQPRDLFQSTNENIMM